jgi:tetratricopeptide (TPR) repeat protein
MVDCGIPSRFAAALPPVDNASLTASDLNSSVYRRLGTDSFFPISPSVHQKVTNNLMYVKPGQGQGERDRAIDWISRALAIDPDDDVTTYNAACTYSLLGQHDRALGLLERWFARVGADERLWFRSDPDFAPLEQHPRYRRLIEAVEHPVAREAGQQGG